MKYYINERNGSKIYTHSEFDVKAVAEITLIAMKEEDPNCDLYVSTRSTKEWREEHKEDIPEPIVQEFGDDEIADESDEELWGVEDEEEEEVEMYDEDDEEGNEGGEVRGEVRGEEGVDTDDEYYECNDECK